MPSRSRWRRSRTRGSSSAQGAEAISRPTRARTNRRSSQSWRTVAWSRWWGNNASPRDCVVSSEIKREGSEQHREDASKYIQLRSARFDLPISRPVLEQFRSVPSNSSWEQLGSAIPGPLPSLLLPLERKGTRNEIYSDERRSYSKGNANISQIFRGNGKRKSSNLRLVFAWEKKKRKKQKNGAIFPASTTEQIQSFFSPHF